MRDLVGEMLKRLRIGARDRVPPVFLYGNASDLTPFLTGPRAAFGATGSIAAAELSYLLVIAGSKGCRVFVDVQSGTERTIAFAVKPVSQLFAVNAPIAPAPVFPAVMNQTGRPIDTRVLWGSIAGASADRLTNAHPGYHIRDVTFANAQFHVGGGNVGPPFLWLAPGYFLQVGALFGETGGFWYWSGYLEEPGEAPMPV